MCYFCSFALTNLLTSEIKHTFFDTCCNSDWNDKTSRLTKRFINLTEHLFIRLMSIAFKWERILQFTVFQIEQYFTLLGFYYLWTRFDFGCMASIISEIFLSKYLNILCFIARFQRLLSPSIAQIRIWMTADFAFYSNEKQLSVKSVFLSLKNTIPTR